MSEVNLRALNDDDKERLDWFMSRVFNDELLRLLISKGLITTAEINKIFDKIKSISIDSIDSSFPHIANPVTFHRALSESVEMHREAINSEGIFKDS